MGMQMTRKQKYRRVLLALAALFLILAVLLGYDAMRESLPDTMYVDCLLYTSDAADEL